MEFGELRQDLAVKLDVRLLQCIDKFGVGGLVQTRGSVDLHLPQTTSITLLQAAVDVGIAPGFADGNFGQLDAGLTLPAVALGSLEKIFAVLDVASASFDAHRLGKWRELLDSAHVGWVSLLVAALTTSNVAGFPGIKVVLAGGPTQDFLAAFLSATAPETLGRCFVSLHFRHSS